MVATFGVHLSLILYFLLSETCFTYPVYLCLLTCSFKLLTFNSFIEILAGFQGVVEIGRNWGMGFIKTSYMHV